MEWTCYAHPPSKNGKPCLHENVGGIGSRGLKLLCCEKCGCTKIASDLRRTQEPKDHVLPNPNHKED